MCLYVLMRSTESLRRGPWAGSRYLRSPGERCNDCSCTDLYAPPPWPTLPPLWPPTGPANIIMYGISFISQIKRLVPCCLLHMMACGWTTNRPEPQIQNCSTKMLLCCLYHNAICSSSNFIKVGKSSYILLRFWMCSKNTHKSFTVQFLLFWHIEAQTNHCGLSPWYVWGIGTNRGRAEAGDQRCDAVRR